MWNSSEYSHGGCKDHHQGGLEQDQNLRQDARWLKLYQSWKGKVLTTDEETLRNRSMNRFYSMAQAFVDKYNDQVTNIFI